MSQKINKWVKFDPVAIGAETPIRVRKGKGKEDLQATVVINQHGQLLEGEDRRLIEWMPEEMNPVLTDEAPASTPTP